MLPPRARYRRRPQTRETPSRVERPPHTGRNINAGDSKRGYGKKRKDTRPGIELGLGCPLSCGRSTTELPGGLLEGSSTPTSTGLTGERCVASPRVLCPYLLAAPTTKFGVY